MSIANLALQVPEVQATDLGLRAVRARGPPPAGPTPRSRDPARRAGWVRGLLPRRAPPGSLWRMLRNERGQTATEYTGMLLLVALIVGRAARRAAWRPGSPATSKQLVCEISGQTCDGTSSTAIRGACAGAWRRSTRC